jgi:CDP-diglyceride synthetase
MTGTQQVLAFVLALLGSASNAIATVTQQRAASRLRQGRAFDLAVLVQLARKPAWLLGLAAVIAGFALQATALGMGRLVVIEPALACGLLFSLALAAWRNRRPLHGTEWAATLAVVGGLAVLLAAGQPTGGDRIATPIDLGLATAGAGGVAAICVVLAGRLGPARRALLLGIGGGVVAGVTDATTKTVATLAVGRTLALFADPRLYLLIVVGLLAFTIQQNGYRAAGLAAFLPAFAVMEPVTGSLLGLMVYREGLNDGTAQVVIEVIAGVAAIWGIARLAASRATPSDASSPAGWTAVPPAAPLDVVGAAEQDAPPGPG